MIKAWFNIYIKQESILISERAVTFSLLKAFWHDCSEHILMFDICFDVYMYVTYYI